MTYARPTRPEELLDLQQAMLRTVLHVEDKYPDFANYRSGGYGREAEPFGTPETLGPDFLAINFGGVILGPLIWVDLDMCNLIEAAMVTVPDDTELHSSFMAFDEAVVWFSRPLRGIDILTWHPAQRDFAPSGINITTLNVGKPEPLPVSELCYWDWGAALRVDNVYDSTNLRRLFVSFNLLVSQPGIASTAEAVIPRHYRKRAERRGQESNVRIVRLRHISHTGQAGNGHHLTKRFIVRGHWRNQTFGPRNSLRRPTWIAPHLKGPEGAPLDTRPTVYVANATPDEATT